MSLRTWIFLLWALAASLQTGAASEREFLIPQFREVVPGIYRGGRPESSGMIELARLKIKTDLNLEDDDDAVEDEQLAAKQLGIHHVSIPLGSFFEPETKDIDLILSVLSDPKSHPVFVHCKHGEDRTGMIIGLFRVEQQGWKPEDAYNEMLDGNFHRILWGLSRYFKKRVGMDLGWFWSSLEPRSFDL